MKPLRNHSKYNDIYTPPPPVMDILPFIKKYKTVWECAAGRGDISNVLHAAGHAVISTDIKGGHDFMTERRECDLILTNPPYSAKNAFLARCIELDKPFALLMPITALSHGKKQARHTLYRHHGIQIIFLGYRVHFITQSHKKQCWFDTAWFTRGIVDEPMLFL